MSTLVAKTLRLLVGIFAFIGLTYISGMDYRQGQEMFFILGGIIIFSLVLDNIWLTLFLWLSVFLFTLGRFQFGFNYIVNLLIGSAVYYVTKINYKKKHVDFYLNCVLWLLAINLIMMALQLCGLDFMFLMKHAKNTGESMLVNNNDPVGFMGFKAAVGVLCAMAIPIIASRGKLYHIAMSLGLFVPLYLTKSSVCVAGGVIGFLFILWHKTSRKAFFTTLLSLFLLATAYVVKVDMPMGHMPTRTNQWKLVVHDCTIHPILGWGLDSFRNMTEKKKHVYAMNPNDGSNGIDYWDNAHNLYIQMWFEWGLIALLLLIGYIRQCSIWFKSAIKEPNTLAITGSLIVFFIVSMAQFPMFLARAACFIIPLFALYEIQTRE